MLIQGFKANDLAARLQFPDRFLRFQVQQAHFKNVVHTREQLGQLKRFADEILGPGSKRMELLLRLRRNDENRKIAALLDFLQTFHYLESVHSRHLEIEKDQIVTISAVEFADPIRIGRGFDRNIAGAAQHTLEQTDIDVFIVNNQDASVENVVVIHHR